MGKVDFTQGQFVQGLKDDGTPESLAAAVERGTAAGGGGGGAYAGISASKSVSNTATALVAASETARRIAVMNNSVDGIWIGVDLAPSPDTSAISTPPTFNGDGLGIYLAPGVGYWESPVDFKEVVYAVTNSSSPVTVTLTVFSEA